MKMMEAKVRIALCALLLLNQGSVASATNNSDVSSIDPHQKENSTTQLPLESHTASTNATEDLDNRTNITSMMNTSSTPMPSINQTSSNQSNIVDNSTASSTPFNHSIQNENSTTSAPTPDPAMNSTTSGLSNNSVSNTSWSQENTSSQTSPSSIGSTKLSITLSLLNSSSTHTTSPSPLNVKGKNSPPLDPLLAGLVSAFIITAGIITLLLFLKFRRRHSGPRFTRLQDLPMDDMMEDLPLSMYSY